MTKIGIIRCEKNADRCPLTSCFKNSRNTEEGFSGYENTELIGVFSCRCPGDHIGSLAKILKSKGAQAVHFCTCTFAHKEEGKWVMDDGSCPNIDSFLQEMSKEAGIPCIKGTAHLPDGFTPEVFG